MKCDQELFLQRQNMLKSICFNSNSNCYCHRTKQQVCLRNVCCQISVSLSARQKGSKMEHFHHWMFPSSSRSFGLLVGNASTGNSKLQTKVRGADQLVHRSDLLVKHYNLLWSSPPWNSIDHCNLWKKRSSAKAVTIIFLFPLSAL